MNLTQVRRIYLVWRTDIAAGGLLIVFMFAAFYFAGGAARVMQ